MHRAEHANVTRFSVLGYGGSQRYEDIWIRSTSAQKGFAMYGFLAKNLHVQAIVDHFFGFYGRPRLPCNHQRTILFRGRTSSITLCPFTLSLNFWRSSLHVFVNGCGSTEKALASRFTSFSNWLVTWCPSSFYRQL